MSGLNQALAQEAANNAAYAQHRWERKQYKKQEKAAKKALSRERKLAKKAAAAQKKKNNSLKKSKAARARVLKNRGFINANILNKSSTELKPMGLLGKERTVAQKMNNISLNAGGVSKVRPIAINTRNPNVLPQAVPVYPPVVPSLESLQRNNASRKQVNEIKNIMSTWSNPVFSGGRRRKTRRHKKRKTRKHKKRKTRKRKKRRKRKTRRRH